MQKSHLLTLSLVLTLAVALVVLWNLTYPSPVDSKNMKYVLWKHDLYPMDVNDAMGAMIGDSGREKLVVGKTKAQLQRKFG